MQLASSMSVCEPLPYKVQTSVGQNVFCSCTTQTCISTVVCISISAILDADMFAKQNAQSANPKVRMLAAEKRFKSAEAAVQRAEEDLERAAENVKMVKSEPATRVFPPTTHPCQIGFCCVNLSLVDSTGQLSCHCITSAINRRKHSIPGRGLCPLKALNSQT